MYNRLTCMITYKHILRTTGSFRTILRLCEKCDLAFVTPSGSLLKALADGYGWTVEVKGDSWVSVTRVLNTMETNLI